jgi:hypothetical protein
LCYIITYCVCCKGWLRVYYTDMVYYGLDLLLSKLSKAQSSGKFRELHTDIKIISICFTLSCLSLCKEKEGSVFKRPQSSLHSQIIFIGGTREH